MCVAFFLLGDLAVSTAAQTADLINERAASAASSSAAGAAAAVNAAQYRFLLALNRDEFFSRQTEPAHWWPDATSVLAGRDVERGGTWLGITRGGRVALLTNVRTPLAAVPSPLTRGALVTSYLTGDSDPLTYLKVVAREVEVNAASYAAFNLIVGDVVKGAFAYYSNATLASPLLIAPGVHAISNAALDTPWPKVSKGRCLFEDVLQHTKISGNDHITSLAERLVEKVLQDAEPANDLSQQQTGCSQHIEEMLSSIFVQGDIDEAAYGTRSSTVIAVRDDLRVLFFERYRGDNGVWREHEFVFDIETKS
eukprot:jgi/Chlat1/7596/Chrsp64S07092